MRLSRLMHALRTSIWPIPLLCLIAGILIVLGTLRLDRRSGYTLIPQAFTGTPTDAQTILSTFATATATLTTLVLTMTLVAIQLAMGQFSPRIVAALLTDRANQVAIGLFGATFVVSVMVLREIRDTDPAAVPGLSMLLAYALMLASVVTLVLFVHHAGQELRAAGLIDLVGDRTRRHITSADPPDFAPPADPDVIPAPAPGNVYRVDRRRLVAAARRADCVLELVPVMGDYVVGGAPLFRVHRAPGAGTGDGRPGGGRIRPEEITRLVLVADERVHIEDLAYGFRKLVDIAERSIAQPFNDPTTTLQALHRLHDLLRLLAVRPLPPGEHRDADGVVRLVQRTMTWDGYVRLAFDEIRLAGAPSPQVTRRLSAALHDLKTVVPPERQAPLDRQLRLLADGVHRAHGNEEDAAAALVPDTEGIGSGPDVTTAIRLDGSRVGPGARPDARVQA
ncbi:DUF2254 domain-containing protein [Geodermatophilus ruber]|uniref:Uncharacterized membrane protein n=1 Tax=Geodermatophilus ruber TaxID=504800 RepID=A0A1I4K1L3_9ACTN|nr:DUF2254 domain-containing protein [Geodermatophilus ruber]SFL72638.1 Uncharacterized membrane protein [Geodermatophilus ruber]